MRKRWTIILATLMSVLLFASQPSIAHAADYSNVGVAVGERAYYAVSITASSVTNMLLVVHGIVGTVVTLNLTWYLGDGTIDSENQITGDISTGSGFIWIYLIASGLQANDPPTSGGSYGFNSTSLGIMAGAIRSINYIKLPNGLLEQRYDQVSGLILQGNVWFFAWLNLTMLDTSFGNPLFRITSIVAIVGVIIVLIVAAVILKRRSGKPKSRKKKK